jgi:phosphomevalonate kinase
MYRRFSPSVLGSLGDVGSPRFEDRLFAVVEDLNSDTPWDAECRGIGARLPRGLQMVLCDVDCGSQTPGMVKKVLAWRQNNREEADKIWNELQHANQDLHEELQRLTQADTPTRDFGEISNLIAICRSWIQKMTAKSQVPIEPSVQTALLDELSELEGVVGGVVPGAGGYDAVALLVHDEQGVADRIRAHIEKWECPVPDNFGGQIGKVRLLGVTHGADGLKNELAMRYSEWI